MQIFMKLIANFTLALFFMACAHAPASENIGQAITSYDWHDSSKGGIYGIGEGWSIEVLPPKYETVTETYTLIHENLGLVTVPAQYEWIKDDSEDLSGEPIIVSTLVTLPAEYKMVIDTYIVENEKTEYSMSDAVYNSEGVILTPRHVKQQVIPVVTGLRERQVLKTPERTVERMIPVERRKGYRYVVKIPASTIENPAPSTEEKTETRRVMSQPWTFIIKNSDGKGVHSFDNFDDLTVFTDSLK